MGRVISLLGVMAQLITILAAILGIAFATMFFIEFALSLGQWEEHFGARLSLYAVLAVAIALLAKGTSSRNRYIPADVEKERREKKINKFMNISLVGVFLGFVLHLNYLV